MGNFDSSIILYAKDKWTALSRCHHIFVISAGLVVTFIIAAALLVLEQPTCDPERAFHRHRNSVNNTLHDNVDQQIMATIVSILQNEPPQARSRANSTEHLLGNTKRTDFEYVIVREIANSSVAQLSCSFWCGALTSVHSRAENNFLKGLQLHANLALVWLGRRVHHQSHGAYKWSDGTDFIFTNWAEDRQLRRFNDRPGGSCIALDRFGRWHDIACEEELPFICKRQTHL